MIQEPIISIRHLNHYFGLGLLQKQVLFDLHLDIYLGETVLMTGPSGSGKTTLITLISGLRSAQSGSLRVLGQELCGASKHQLVLACRHIGFIFQAHNLHRSFTALQNVQMGLEFHCQYSHKAMQQQATEILEIVGLGDRMNDYPDDLSREQKQRVAIARALVNRPTLVLADEPTAALDSKSGRDVVNLMQTLARECGSSILVTTHDNRNLDIVDRFVHMEDGALINNTQRKSAALAE